MYCQRFLKITNKIRSKDNQIVKYTKTISKSKYICVEKYDIKNNLRNLAVTSFHFTDYIFLLFL
jgi:hypothetical protein